MERINRRNQVNLHIKLNIFSFFFPFFFFSFRLSGIGCIRKDAQGRMRHPSAKENEKHYHYHYINTLEPHLRNWSVLQKGETDGSPIENEFQISKRFKWVSNVSNESQNVSNESRNVSNESQIPHLGIFGPRFQKKSASFKRDALATVLPRLWPNKLLRASRLPGSRPLKTSQTLQTATFDA